MPLFAVGIEMIFAVALFICKWHDNRRTPTGGKKSHSLCTRNI